MPESPKRKVQASVEDRCRKKLAELFNRPPQSGLMANQNNGRFYISGRPDDEIVLRDSRILFVEAKGFSGAAFLGDPSQPAQTVCKSLGRQYKAVGWHTHQRNWWREFCLPLKGRYLIALLVDDTREKGRIQYKDASLFLVPPEAWLALEAKLGGRMTCALNADLEAEHAYKGITLDVEFAAFRLDYTDGAFVIPPSHPFHNYIYGDNHD